MKRGEYHEQEGNIYEKFFHYFMATYDPRQEGKVPSLGCHFKFPLIHPDYPNYVGKSGTAYLYLTDNSYISNAEVLVKYGHKVFAGTIEVSYPGGVSIKFGGSVNETEV